MKDHHKMRAWDKVKKIYVSALEYQMILLKIQGGEDDCSPHLDNCFWYPDWVAERFDHELCTGIRDKNGVLIYEGDKVRAHRFYFDGKSEEEIIGHVCWDNNADARWVILTEDSYYSFPETSHFQDPCIEIIGNIHENPELLEVKP